MTITWISKGIAKGVAPPDNRRDHINLAPKGLARGIAPGFINIAPKELASVTTWKHSNELRYEKFCFSKNPICFHLEQKKSVYSPNPLCFQ
jgi:hypothetical protein